MLCQLADRPLVCLVLDLAAQGRLCLRVLLFDVVLACDNWWEVKWVLLAFHPLLACHLVDVAEAAVV